MYALRIPIRFALVLLGVPSIDICSGLLTIGPPEFPGKVCASTRNIGVPFFNKNASVTLEIHPSLQMGTLIGSTKSIGNPKAYTRLPSLTPVFCICSSVRAWSARSNAPQIDLSLISVCGRICSAIISVLSCGCAENIGTLMLSYRLIR